MPIYSKESLETLRQRIDLVDVLSAHLDLKRSGAAYKGLCPFHDEKTPSFIVQKGDTHYHCFGCGAHGDAIQFLMGHQKMNFLEAVESLAQRFEVHLDRVEEHEEKKGLDKSLLKKALEQTSLFYHFILLHSEEGHKALQYLYGRGIDLEFIRQFRFGLAPKSPGLYRKTMHALGFNDAALLEAGLISITRDDSKRDFFYDRITIPIHHPSGYIIGFTARKFKEDTFGGKYVNSSETVLFKKSKILFGLNYTRRRIAKERKAIIVEGQIDALRLIQAGFNIAVAGQGTAFGEGQVQELINLGINQVYLALDSDSAGQEATRKIGNLFQKAGVEVNIVQLPAGKDPDSLIKEKGAEGFLHLLSKSVDYLTFLVLHQSQSINMASPAGKNELVHAIAQQIRQWDNSLMVHESLRKLAHLAQVPESLIGVGEDHIPNIYVKQADRIGLQAVDPHRVLESDLIRWMHLLSNSHSKLITTIFNNIQTENFKDPLSKSCFQAFLVAYEQKSPCDLISLAIHLGDKEGQQFISDLMQKKVNKDRGEEQCLETLQKILNRNWMEKREAIKMTIQSGQCSDDEALSLAKQFDELHRQPPEIQ